MTTNMEFGGDWTRQKLGMLGQYLNAYTTALKNQPFNLTYVDAFAGSGTWTPKSRYEPDGLLSVDAFAGSGISTTESGYEPNDYGEFQELAKGSARIALEVDDKPFDRLVFIEKNPANAASLRDLRGDYPNRDILIINDDANIALPDFCRGMGRFDRAVVFLDPFKTEVEWGTVEAVAKTQKIDCWILFPRMAITRMMPRENEPSKALSLRLDKIFGGREYWSGLYSAYQQSTIFGDEQTIEQRGDYEVIRQSYRKRLESAFAGVAPTSRALRSSQNSILFDLFFAAGNPRGAKRAMPIADHILKRW